MQLCNFIFTLPHLSFIFSLSLPLYVLPSFLLVSVCHFILSLSLSDSLSPFVPLCEIIVALSVSLCKNRRYDITSYDLFMLIIYSYVSLSCAHLLVLLYSQVEKLDSKFWQDL